MSNFIKVLLASIALLLPSLAQASEEGAPMDVEGSVRIDLEQGMSLWEEEAVFLDVRPESNFEAGRIPGAVNLHVDSALTQESIATVVAQDVSARGLSGLGTSRFPHRIMHAIPT